MAWKDQWSGSERREWAAAHGYKLRSSFEMDRAYRASLPGHGADGYALRIESVAPARGPTAEEIAAARERNTARKAAARKR